VPFAALFWWLYIITVHQASSAHQVSFSLAIFFMICCFFEEHDSIYHNKHLLSSYSLPRLKPLLLRWDFFFPKRMALLYMCTPVFNSCTQGFEVSLWSCKYSKV